MSLSLECKFNSYPESCHNGVISLVKVGSFRVTFNQRGYCEEVASGCIDLKTANSNGIFQCANIFESVSEKQIFQPNVGGIPEKAVLNNGLVTPVGFTASPNQVVLTGASAVM